MAIELSSEVYPQLMDLINLTYRDKVESIVAAKVKDNGDIVAVAMDGRKKLAIGIVGNIISIKLIGESAAFAKAPARAPKKKTCKPENISCGFTCISGKKICRISMTLEQQKAAKEIKAKMPTAPKTEALSPEDTTSPETLDPRAAGYDETIKGQLRSAHPEKPNFDLKMDLNTIKGIDERILSGKATDADRYYRSALLAPIGNNRIGGEESSMDRIDFLKKQRDNLDKGRRLDPDNIRELPSSWGQGMRGGGIYDKAAIGYTAEIFNRLPAEQQSIFVAALAEYLPGVPSQQKNWSLGEAADTKQLKTFVGTLDKLVRAHRRKEGG